MTDATTTPIPRPLLPELFALLAAHCPAFRQERPSQRSVALLLGWVCAFGRHTLTQVLLALGLGETDWTAFYRLFSRRRVDYDVLSRCLLAETLAQVPATRPYLVGLDATQIPRHSRTMPGTSWLRHLGTAIFRAGIHRAQRFVHLAWLPQPSPAGYSRAVPLRFDPAFPPKAVPAPGSPPQTEWAAGLAALTWLRQELDALGRTAQLVLGLGDGAYSTTRAGLPARVVLLARCAKNRALFALPRAQDQPARGRRRQYGERRPRPEAWLADRSGWQRTDVVVRERTIPLQYRVDGPCLVQGAAQQPLYLLVVKGSNPQRGYRPRPARFWLVSAVPDGAGGWRLPWPAAQLLAWAWQRWELEVAHRELKTSFGLGEMQCGSPVAAVLSVQWTAWAGCGVGAGRAPRLGPRHWSGALARALVARCRPLVVGTPVARLSTGTLAGDRFSPGLGSHDAHLVGNGRLAGRQNQRDPGQ